MKTILFHLIRFAGIPLVLGEAVYKKQNVKLKLKKYFRLINYLRSFEKSRA